MRSLFTKINITLLILFSFFSEQILAQEEFVFEDLTATMQVTAFNTSNCIGGFNNQFGTKMNEGLNIVNGQPVFIGVGRAVVSVNIDGKGSSWANALSKAFMKAELRGKIQIVEDRKTRIEQEIIFENTTKSSDGTKPANVNETEMSTWEKVKFVVTNKLSDVLEIDALEFEISQKEAAIKDIVRQNNFQRVINAAAYSEITGMQSIYTNYHKDKNEFCVVVLKNTDSSLMAKALGSNKLTLLMPNTSKAGLPIMEQIPSEDSKLLFSHGVRVMRDENGSPILVVFGMQSFKRGPEASIDAERLAKLKSKANIAAFIKEKIDVEIKTTINEINTTYAGKSEDGSDLVEYFTEDRVEERTESSVAESVSGMSWLLSREFTNPLSNETVYVVVGSISLESLQNVLSTTLEGMNRERV